MCWAIAIGYVNNIKPSLKTMNFYLLDDSNTMNKIDELKNLNDDLNILGWREDNNEKVLNKYLNREVENINVLTVKGKLSLLIQSQTLLEDDVKGCLIDKETAYKLFGDTNVIGNKIMYKNRELTIVGMHNDSLNNIIVNGDDEENLVLNGITIDVTGLSITEIEEFKNQNLLDSVNLSGKLYYNLAKNISLLLPTLALSIVLFKLLKKVYRDRRKPLKIILYIISTLIIIFLFTKIININIEIPLDMLPNKWSDFEFWSILFKEYKEKYEYVINMKKYGFDIYNINNLLISTIYSTISIVLFVLNIKYIKFKNNNEVIKYIFITIVVTFIIVLFSSYNCGFDVNTPMIWLIYPLYVLSEFYLSKNCIHK